MREVMTSRGVLPRAPPSMKRQKRCLLDSYLDDLGKPRICELNAGVAAMSLTLATLGCAVAMLSELSVLSISPPQAHLVVYYVDFHGATSHTEIPVVKVDGLNHDKKHVIIHMVL